MEKYLHIPIYNYTKESEDPEKTGTQRERRKELHRCMAFMPKELTDLLVDADGSPCYTMGASLTVFASNLNVMRIMSGISGLSYST